jgi:hypothetical protein
MCEIKEWRVDAESTRERERIMLLHHKNGQKEKFSSHVIPDDNNKMRTVLLLRVEKSKKGGPSNCLLLSLIFRF